MDKKTNKKIKVLLVLCNNVLNGTERYVVDLAKNLSRDSFDVSVATPVYGPLSEILKENEIKEEIYNNGKVYKYSFKGLLNLKQLIKKNNYDVLHANAGIWPCLMGKLSGTRLIVETKHGIFYSDEQLDSMSIFRKAYEIFKKYLVNYFIAISDNDKKKLIKYFKTDESKIKVIYNGLDFSFLDFPINKVKYSDRNDFVFGNVGRVTFQKAQEVLLHSVDLLKEDTREFKLVLLGSGENEEKVKNIIKEKNLEDILILESYKKNVFDYLSGFQCLVLTSRFEGVPYVVLEAMALGIPVISTNVGGISNVLTDGYDSLITEVDNPTSTKEAMKKMILDNEFREIVILNAKKTINSYTVQRMAQETGRFYQNNL